MSGASKSPHDPVQLAQRMAAGEAFGVLFREVKSQAADSEIDDLMTVPRSRPE